MEKTKKIGKKNLNTIYKILFKNKKRRTCVGLALHRESREIQKVYMKE